MPNQFRSRSTWDARRGFINEYYHTLPRGYPSPHELRRLARRLHVRGPDTLHRFLTSLLAGPAPTTLMILRALDPPDVAPEDGHAEADAPPWLRLAPKDSKP